VIVHTALSTTAQHLRAGAVFGACVLATFLFPFVAIRGQWSLPRLIENTLFFFPQIMCPYYGFVIPQPFQTRGLFSDSTALLLSIGQWVLFMVLFALLARRVKMRYLIPVSFAAVIFLAFAVPFLFSLFGVTLELDGP
jgi:hypothetical protein